MLSHGPKTYAWCAFWAGFLALLGSDRTPFRTRINSFNENVKRRRKRLGLILEQLSEKCGVSRSMLSEIERGEKNPTIQLTCHIAEALGTTVSYLLGEQQTQTTVVIRREQRLVYRDESSGFERHPLSPSTGTTDIEFVLNVVAPGKESGVFPPTNPA